MKTLIILFGIYLLSISCLPCNDNDVSTDIKCTTIETSTKHHENHQDFCSPFCTCNCCRTNIVLLQTHIFIQKIFIEETIKINLPIRNQSATTFYTKSIWQPPNVLI